MINQQYQRRMTLRTGAPESACIRAVWHHVGTNMERVVRREGLCLSRRFHITQENKIPCVEKGERERS